MPVYVHRTKRSAGRRQRTVRACELKHEPAPCAARNHHAALTVQEGDRGWNSRRHRQDASMHSPATHCCATSRTRQKCKNRGCSTQGHAQPAPRWRTLSVRSVCPQASHTGAWQRVSPRGDIGADSQQSRGCCAGQHSGGTKRAPRRARHHWATNAVAACTSHPDNRLQSINQFEGETRTPKARNTHFQGVQPVQWQRSKASTPHPPHAFSAKATGGQPPIKEMAAVVPGAPLERHGDQRRRRPSSSGRP
jgi:hypothetical protein